MRSVETIEVGENDGEPRIDRWLRRRFPQLTQGQVEKLLRTGQVRVDGARVKASDRVSPGQSVRIPPAVTGRTLVSVAACTPGTARTVSSTAL